MGWLTDEEFVDRADPKTPTGKALHARLTRLVYEGMAREAELEGQLMSALAKVDRLELDIAALMEG